MAERKQKNGGTRKAGAPKSPTFTRQPSAIKTGRDGLPLRGQGETVIYEPPAGMSLALDEIDRAAESRSETRAAILRLRDGLDALDRDLGVTPYRDAVVAKTVRAMLGALEKKREVVAERDLASRLVRDAGASLAKALRTGRTEITAETLADETISKSA